MKQTNSLTSKYSVLMSVYNLEKPENLYQSIKSMLSQTVLPDEFILVCDGLLNDELNNVIEKIKDTKETTFKVVQLKEHAGLSVALNVGLSQCTNEFVARMDSDDISYPDRCQKQLEVFKLNPELAICSGTVDEFSYSISSIISKRILPEKQPDILKYSKYRNPFNHPCVMYKKSVIEKLGGYEDFFLLEDYQLWIKLLLNGYKGYNIQESILYMRTGSALYKRRGGIKYAVSQNKLFFFMFSCNYISIWQLIFSCIIRNFLAIIPDFLRQVVYKNIVRIV